MPDVKISALTSASTPLAGTEVLPIVQTSATVKVSIANLTAGRAVSAASIATIPSSTPTTIATANQIRIGESSNNTNYRMELGYFNNGANGYNGSIQVYDNNNAEDLILNGAGGNVGIGTASTSYQLQLSTDSAAKPTTNLWTIASDSRIKTETGEYTKGLDAVCALRPVTYYYNGTAGFVNNGKENISIIAQEAMQHFPECVGTFEALLNEDDDKKTELFNWNGHALIFALVNAIKELKAMNQSLATRIVQLEVSAKN